MDQEKSFNQVGEIITPFDVHLISSPHVFTMDKDRCNEIEVMIEPLTTPCDTETIGQQNKEVRGRLVEGLDALIGAEECLTHGERNEISKVIIRKRDKDLNFIGRKHNNPI